MIWNPCFGSNAACSAVPLSEVTKGWVPIATVCFREKPFHVLGTLVSNHSGMLMLDPLVNPGMVPRPSSWLRLEPSSRFPFEPHQPSAAPARSCCLVVTRRLDFRSSACCSRMSIICSDMEGGKKESRLFDKPTSSIPFFSLSSFSASRSSSSVWTG